MASKQANLRRLMKIEREKKKKTTQTILKTNNQEISLNKETKGILKTKPSYQSSSDGKDNKGSGSLANLMVGYSDSEDSDDCDAMKKNYKCDNDINILTKNDRQPITKKTQAFSPQGLKRNRTVAFTEDPVVTGESSQSHEHNRPLHNNQQAEGLSNFCIGDTSDADVQNPVGNPDVMKEFEELLNCSVETDNTNDVIEKNDLHSVSIEKSNSTTSIPNKSIDQKVQPRIIEDEITKSDSLSSIMTEYTDNVEQMAYEARLARLILLRTKKKHKKTRKTAEYPFDSVDRVSPHDYVPALAFHDTITGGNDEVISKNSSADILKNRDHINKSARFESIKTSTSVPLSSILREKRAKEGQMSKSYCDDMEDLEYDAYWK